MPSTESQVAVLLAVHNGQAWLAQQLRTVLTQQGVRIVVLAGDDGSTDESAAVVREELGIPGGPHALLRMRHGNATRTFLDLLGQALGRWPDTQWFAFCDQDDIWLPDKLSRALRALDPAGRRPALYGARTLIVDEQDRELGLSRLHSRTPAFRNAIVQSIMGGNTMVINRAAAELLAVSAAPGLQSHDWWAYILVSGCGGHVVYDPEPRVRYRQHHRNQVGSNRGLRAALQRLGRLWRGDFGTWNQRNLAALEPFEAHLTDDSRQVLHHWRQACVGVGPFTRWRHLRASGVWRQNRREQWMLLFACLAGRLKFDRGPAS